MTRRFVEALSAATGSSTVKAVYPDAGVAAMLDHQWGDRGFGLASLNARRPTAPEDDLIVICCPDPFTAEECQRTVRQVTDADEAAGVMPRPVVLFNQRLSRCVRRDTASEAGGRAGGVSLARGDGPRAAATQARVERSRHPTAACCSCCVAAATPQR
jgi:hypothetical protein